MPDIFDSIGTSNDFAIPPKDIFDHVANGGVLKQNITNPGLEGNALANAASTWVMEPIGKLITGALNLPAKLGNAIPIPGLPQAPMPFQYGARTLPVHEVVDYFNPFSTQSPYPLEQGAAGFIQNLGQQADSLTTPENLALIPVLAEQKGIQGLAMLQKFIGSLFATQMIGGAPEAIKNVYDQAKAGASPGELGASMAQVVAPPVLGGMILKHGGKVEETPKTGQVPQFGGATVNDLGDLFDQIAPVSRQLTDAKRTFYGNAPAVETLPEDATPEQRAEYSRQQAEFEAKQGRARTPQDVRILGQQDNPALVGQRTGPQQEVLPVEQPGASQRDLQGGQVSFSSPAREGGIPNARQAANELLPEERATVDKFLADEESGGNPVNVQTPGISYRRPQPAPTLREAELQKQKANVEQGMYSAPVPMEPLQPEVKQYPEGAQSTRALSTLQRSRLRVALEQGKPISYIRNVLRTSDTLDQGAKPVRVGELPKSATAPINEPGDLPRPNAPIVPKEYADSEKGNRGGFVLEGPMVVNDRASMGFSPEAKPDGKQVMGRLENLAKQGKISGGELEVYKKQGLEEFLKGKPTMAEVGKWMQENGPRVETKVLRSGEQPKAVADNQRKMAELQHDLETSGYKIDSNELWDNKPPEPGYVKRPVASRSDRNIGIDSSNVPKDVLDKYNRWYDLNLVTGEQGERNNTFDPDVYRSIAPKDKDQTVVMVRVPVPEAPGNELSTPTKLNSQALHQGNHFGTEDRNVLGWARVQYHTAKELREINKDNPKVLELLKGMSDEEKVAHVIEVQSDWGQRVRDLQQREGAMERVERSGRQLDHPLLKDYSRLVLKAAIDQARKDGAKHIAVSDAETAMMTEGHDLARTPVRIPFNTEQQARDYLKQLPQREGGSYTVEEKGKSWYAVYHEGLPQEPGMRLNYDRVLPKTLEELTGNKGEKVEFGEHQRAFEIDRSRHVYNRPLTQTELGGQDRRIARPNLIFKNPDGTPKTSATALSYPLDKIAERNQPFTLMGKRYSPAFPGVDTFSEAKKIVPPYVAKEIDRLGLKDGMNAYDLAKNLAESPVFHGKDNAALAGFLTKHFETPLKSVKVEAGGYKGAQGRLFDLYNNTIHLDVGRQYSRVESGHNPLLEDALHESAHAATAWAVNHPVTERQKMAVKQLEEVRQQALNSFPDKIKEFAKGPYADMMEKVRQGKEGILGLLRLLDDNNISRAWHDRLYATANKDELIGQMFSRTGVRDWLDDIQYQGKGLIGRLKDIVKNVLGMESGSLADKTLDALMELGAEGVHPGENARAGYPGWEFAWAPHERLMDNVEGKEVPVIGSSSVPGKDVGPSRSWKELRDGYLNKWANWSAPKTVAADEGLGNALVRYASARIAAPQIGEAMASGVLGKFAKDAKFNDLLGKVAVEDRLRALRDLHEKNGDAELAGKVTSVMSDKDFQDALKNKDVQNALLKHQATVQVDAERMHRLLGGKMSVAGKETGTFVNLIAMLDPDDVEAAKGFIYGSKKGDVLNPLQRNSAFNKQAKGTSEAYDTSYRNMVTRAYRGNYEEYAKQKMYDAYVKSGLAVEERPGVKAPTFGGQPAVKIPIDLRAGKRTNLWVRSDLAPELRQALQTDSPLQKAGLAYMGDLATEFQVMGPTDFVFHLGNMLAALKWSQGGAKTGLGDLARKLPFYQGADLAWKLYKSASKVWLNGPEIQRDLANLAMIGAGRAEARHEGLVTKTLEKFGVPHEVAQKADPNYYSSMAIKFFDKVGRATANDMFDTLVSRGWAKDTELDRREFINRMGQYNERLMTKNQQLARESGVGPFVTAGRTFNRLAMQRMMQSPGFRAANPQAWAKSRIVETLGTLGVMFAFPVAWNMAMTGKPFGNQGIPSTGALDLNRKDKDGREQYIDLLQGNLLRRGMRISGLSSVDKDVSRDAGVGETTMNAGKAIALGMIHPWAGPVVQDARIAMTGKDMSGFLVSRNPENVGENLKAMLKQVNPTVASLANDQGGPVKQVEQVAGLKSGTAPTFEQKAEDAANAKYGKPWEKLNQRQQAAVKKGLEATQEPRSDLATRAAGEKAYWSDLQRKDDLQSALPKEQAEFITDNKLTMPGYKEEHTVDKEQIPLTNAQRKEFEKVVQEKYTLFIGRLMDNDKFDDYSQQQKQAMLERYLTTARRQAWAAYRVSSAKPTPTGRP